MIVGAFAYLVQGKKQETPTTATLSLTKLDGTIPRYRPGQCITVYVPDFSMTLGKQYSISSAPSEETCAITVKAIGRFSQRLCSLSPGDHLCASDPHGVFYPKRTNDIVLLAGGMGITPFRSIVLEALAKQPGVRIRLLYSAKIAADMPFADELDRISYRYKALSLERFVTQESRVSSLNLKYRRMRPDDILKTSSSTRTQFLLSGSLTFVLTLKNTLTVAGIPRECILTEAYF